MRNKNVHISKDPEVAYAQLSLFKIDSFLWSSEKLLPSPTAALRGCLFGAKKPGSEKYVKDALVFENKEMTITYTGMELGQHHLDLWLEIVQRVGQRFLDPANKDIVIDTGVTDLLRATGRLEGNAKKRKNKGEWKPGNTNREWLVEKLEELKGTIKITTPHFKKGILGSLIKDVWWDGDDMKIEVSNIIGNMFAAGHTNVNRQVRKNMMGDPTALWLYGFIVSCKNSKNHFFYGYDTIHAACGSESKAIRKFGYQIRRKMQKIMQFKTDKDFYGYASDKKTLYVFYTKNQMNSWKRSIGWREQKQCPLPIEVCDK